MNSNFKYRPEIDGLRCVAVLGVIIFHVDKNLLLGGYLGVDVFFVISGYLITSIILREISSNKFSLSNFWIRRIKRILPAATFVLIVTSLYQFFFSFKPDLLLQSGQKIAALLSYANIYFWINVGDYWGTASEESPFIHYWSLSVEEQYYLIYPFLILLISKYWRKTFPKALILVLSVSVFLSLIFFFFGTYYFPSATFYLLPTRIWQLGAGCLLALMGLRLTGKKSSTVTILGLILILLAFLFPLNSSGVGFESIIVVIGSFLIIWSGSNSISKIFLENRLMLFLGKISFSLYLWHWPIIVLIKKININSEFSDVALILFGGLILILLSLFSYYLIENTFRTHKYGTYISLSLLLFTVLVFVFVEPKYNRNQYDSNYNVPTWYGRYYDLKPSGEVSQAVQIISNSLKAPKRVASATSYKRGGIIRTSANKNIQLVLIGDSHAVMWSKVIDDITKEQQLTASLWSMNGVSGLISIPPKRKVDRYLTKRQRFEYDSSRLHLIEKWKPDIVIVSNNWVNVNFKEAEEMFNFLEKNAKNVVILESPPALNSIGNRSVFQYFSFLGLDKALDVDKFQLWEPFDFKEINNTRQSIKKVVANRNNFSFLPTADLFLLNGHVKVALGQEVYYLDDDHLTNEGANLARERISSTLQRILNKDIP